MPKTIIAGNWKMNKNHQEAEAFFTAAKEKFPADLPATLLVIPPALFLWKACEEFADTAIAVGAQNSAEEDSGAFTGEISPQALKTLGVQYVLVGHSERRQIYKETDDNCQAKVKKALDNQLIPILCVGETLEQREAGQAENFITEQIKAALTGLSEQELTQVVLAYEPIWAIGTGKTASAEEAEAICQVAREAMYELAGSDIAEATSILYGGSVKPDNAKEILSQANINGVLVGGASLEVDSFKAIAEAVK